MKHLIILSSLFILLFLPCAAQKKASKNQSVSDTQKKAFIKLLGKLPRKGEFFTEEAGKKATPYLPVLFAFNEKEITKNELYPFMAISLNLLDIKKNRDYAVAHFSEIQNPYIKFFWGGLLFNSGEASTEIVQFLKDGVNSPTDSQFLSEMIGPKFEEFKKRVLEYPINK